MFYAATMEVPWPRLLNTDYIEEDELQCVVMGSSKLDIGPFHFQVLSRPFTQFKLYFSGLDPSLFYRIIEQSRISSSHWNPARLVTGTSVSCSSHATHTVVV